VIDMLFVSVQTIKTWQDVSLAAAFL